MLNIARRPALLALVALLVGGVAATPTRADITIKITRDDGKKVNYVLSYTPEGEKQARHFGVYETSKDASAVATALQREGHTVHIRGDVAEIPVAELPDETEAGATGVCTLEDAKKVFAALAAQKDIAFEFPRDGCYARAHLMCRRLQQAGYTPGKVWSFANGQPLYAKTAHDPAGFVQWSYHVAPVLAVKMPDNRVICAVADPSLFGSLVTVGKWRDAQKPQGAKYDPIIRVTKYGVAPVSGAGYQLPGHGYWTGNDPRDMDAYSARIMKLAKPYENRTGPADLFTR